MGLRVITFDEVTKLNKLIILAKDIYGEGVKVLIEDDTNRIIIVPPVSPQKTHPFELFEGITTAGYAGEYVPFVTYNSNDPCNGCSNKPKQGEFKVCHCVLPLLNNSITY